MMDIANGMESLISLRTSSRRYSSFLGSPEHEAKNVLNDWKPPPIRVIEIENFSKLSRNRSRSLSSNLSSCSDFTLNGSFSVESPKQDLEFSERRKIKSYSEFQSMDDENFESNSSRSSSDSEDGDWAFVHFGVPCSLKYRILLLDRQGMEASFWHHVSLFTGDGKFNIVCKTPRGSWLDYECAAFENFNPLKLKEKDGSPTHFAENTKWNYGFFPQTWLDSSQYNNDLNIYQSSGVVEVFDIGLKRRKTGDIYSVKILAAFPLVDSTERLAWKVVAIASDDPTADKLNTFEDMDKFHSGTLNDIQEWLRTCNCVKPGDSENSFALDHLMSEGETMAIIAEAHASWQLLVDNEPPLKTWSLPLTRPIKPSMYASLWADQTKNVSGFQIPFSDSLLGSSLRYDRAWAMPETRFGGLSGT